MYAQARLKGTPVLQHPDPALQRLLLDAQTEVAEAKAIKNLRLHERRLRRQYEQDKAELIQLRKERFEREEREQEAAAQREREEAEQQRRQEQARKRAERRRAQAEAAEPIANRNGFEFTGFANASANPYDGAGNESDRL